MRFDTQWAGVTQVNGCQYTLTTKELRGAIARRQQCMEGAIKLAVWGEALAPEQAECPRGFAFWHDTSKAGSRAMPPWILAGLASAVQTGGLEVIVLAYQDLEVPDGCKLWQPA